MFDIKTEAQRFEQDLKKHLLTVRAELIDACFATNGQENVINAMRACFALTGEETIMDKILCRLKG